MRVINHFYVPQGALLVSLLSGSSRGDQKKNSKVSKCDKVNQQFKNNILKL